MLQKQAVDARTFSLLEELMDLSHLSNFYLVGGTALALRYGHRRSIDLDLFGQNLNVSELTDHLSKYFKTRFKLEETPGEWAIFSFIDEVKVDIIKYDHPTLKAPEEIERVRMYATEDIAAMKIGAILGRGTKRDFWDIYELLHMYSIEEIISFYLRKFPKQQLLISVPQAMVYFKDAEESEDPISLKGQSWDLVKEFIKKKVSEYLS